MMKKNKRKKRIVKETQKVCADISGKVSLQNENASVKNNKILH